ncbi:MAG: aminopeptidase P family protein [Alphaproteobacteria bacterium]|nr:aminopeptidase P family protein [Alphaproteobacteria bacterium]
MTRTPDIAHAEFADRRRRAVAAASARGLDALLICSRGGGTVDRFANAVYLANFYTSFPYISDLAPDWTARAHTFLILPVGRDPRLIADVPYISEVALPGPSIVQADDVLAALIAELQSLGLSRARIGFVGEDIMPWSAMRQVQAALPDIGWEKADDILAELRAVKSPAEIGLLREASRIGSRMIEAMLDEARPGATHGDIVAAGQQVLTRAGGILYNSFMASGTGGENPTVYRCNFPTWGNPHKLAEGEWLRLGISGLYRGYYFDLSRSKSIGRPSNHQVDAFEAAISVVQEGLATIRVGATAGEVADRAFAKQEKLGYPIQGVFSGMGHGIGLGWDSPWLVRGEKYVLKPGMVLNVERTLQRDGYLGDFEETVLLTENGTELLTDARMRNW